MRPSATDEVHRYLLTWIDHASILNKGHLVITIRVMYTPKIFFADDEMLVKTGIIHDVQEIVETPSLYIIGQTNDSLAEKLTYTEARLDDIKNLTPLRVDGKTITDKLRFFLGKKSYIHFS